MRFFSKTTKAAYPADDLEMYREAGTLPDDLVEVTDEAWAAVMAAEAAGKVIGADANGFPIAIDPPPKPAAEVRATYEAKAQALLDSAAKAWGYDSIISAASYASSGVAQYKADAAALIAWRDALWQAAYNIDVSTKNGQAAPATADDFLVMLPPAPARPTA